MFKDELAGTPIEEFCALKPKLYALVACGYGKVSAKGTKKFAHSKLHHDMFKKTHHDMFKETLATADLFRIENFMIASEKHQLQTVCVNKTALSAYDDKRYINVDTTTTLPFGHFSLRDEYLTQKICEDSDWGSNQMTIKTSLTYLSGEKNLVG